MKSEAENHQQKNRYPEEIGLSSKAGDHKDLPERGYFSLALLRPGEQGRIVQIHCNGFLRRRLLDLGLVPGTLVEAVMSSPWGDPVAYRVRSSLLAIRREDAGKIEIQPILQEKEKTDGLPM